MQVIEFLPRVHTNQQGSPLNLLWPHAFEINTQALLNVLKQYQVPHAIFYGAKANKSQCMLGAAANSGIGVDVSSIHELNAALRAGVPGANICATGPAKTAVFHQALISAGSMIYQARKCLRELVDKRGDNRVDQRRQHLRVVNFKRLFNGRFICCRHS